jgi:hypothetical protein
MPGRLSISVIRLFLDALYGSEVSAGDARSLAWWPVRRRSLGIRRLPEFLHAALQDRDRIEVSERAVCVAKSDSAGALGVAAELFSMAGIRICMGRCWLPAALGLAGKEPSNFGNRSPRFGNYSHVRSLNTRRMCPIRAPNKIPEMP